MESSKSEDNQNANNIKIPFTKRKSINDILLNKKITRNIFRSRRIGIRRTKKN